LKHRGNGRLKGVMVRRGSPGSSPSQSEMADVHNSACQAALNMLNGQH